MNPQDRPSFAKGVKLRIEPDGAAMLLVPEGVLMLNAPAAATLDLIDGRRRIVDIVAAIVERFDVDSARAGADVGEIIDRLARRGFIE